MPEHPYITNDLPPGYTSPESSPPYEDRQQIRTLTQYRDMPLLKGDMYGQFPAEVFQEILARANLSTRRRIPCSLTPAIPAPPPPKAWHRRDVTDEQVIAACEPHAGGSSSFDRLVATTGAPPKVALAAMFRAARKGLIDYGVSLERAWKVNR